VKWLLFVLARLYEQLPSKDFTNIQARSETGAKQMRMLSIGKTLNLGAAPWIGKLSPKNCDNRSAWPNKLLSP
jgi:hypothetical protein